MAINPLETKDCHPFENLETKDEIALKRLCEYFLRTRDNRKDNDDEIATLRTTKADDGEFRSKWWAGRYIGVAYISLPKGTTKEISIRPRFGLPFLFALLEDLYGMQNIKESIHDGNNIPSNEWFSALLNLLRRRIWVDKCAKANRYDLPRKNKKVEYQGIALRGSLDVSRTVLPWMTQRELCSSFYEKSYDDTICRIVYEANRILSQCIIENRVGVGRKKRISSGSATVSSSLGFSIPPAVQTTIDALNSQFKGTPFTLSEYDYQHIRYNNIYLSWKPLVDFSWSVIQERQFGYRAAESQTQCIFIDMAEIWEAFLRKKLGEGFSDSGWRVLSIEECTFEIYSAQFYRRDIIPDIILEKDGQFMVFDAKYKHMRGIRSSLKDSDLDRTDLFQIHTYIQYVQHYMGEVVVGGLLYPISAQEVNPSSWHSNSLFGLDGSTQIPFIVDGIVCSDINGFFNMEQMGSGINNMINRIKQVIAMQSVNNTRTVTLKANC